MLRRSTLSPDRQFGAERLGVRLGGERHKSHGARFALPLVVQHLGRDVSPCQGEITGEAGDAQPDRAVVTVSLRDHLDGGGAARRDVNVRRGQLQGVVSRFRPGDQPVAVRRSALTAQVADRQRDLPHFVGRGEGELGIGAAAHILGLEPLALGIVDGERSVKL